MKKITTLSLPAYRATDLNFIKFIYILCMIIVSIAMHAKPVTPTVAQNAGAAFLNQRSHMAVSKMTLVHTETTTQGEAVYYVFNINETDGFVIISADDATHPVIGYVTSGQYTPAPAGSSIAFWLNKKKSEIIHARTKQLSPVSKITAEWTGNTMSMNNRNNGNASVMDVSPLISTTWNQSPYYNAQCPSGSVTGCIATAMAQIMKFWSYPATGTGASSYCDCSATPPSGFTMANNYGTLSATYSTTTYSWSSMPLNVTSANAAVATLMYQCGVSVDMNYDPSGSSSYLIYSGHPCALNSYKQYFSYDSLTIQGLTRASYADSVWSSILVNDLTHGRPIQYAGADATQGGHSWVCDGYRSSDGFFHMNWGWGGAYNGYYSLDALNPSTYDFIQTEQAIVGIQPVLPLPPVSDFTSNTTTKCGSGSITFKDQSSNTATSWSWTFPGGTPATSTAQNPVITYTAPGTYSVTLTASNSHGTGSTVTKTGYITILSTSMPTACTPSTGNLSNNYGIGTYNVTLNTINNNSGGAVSDGGYVNFSCQNYTTLQLSTTYTIGVTVGSANNENIKVFIDYNNNGSFADAGELIFQTSAVKGLQVGTFTTPASPTTGTYLRMRVIDDFSTISNSCNNLSYGQAEDYGVYFNAVAPVAAFSSNVTSVCAGNSVNYTDQSTNMPTSWAWTFQGGTPATSTLQNPVITYSAAGTYSVSLLATNTGGNNTKTINGYITVNVNPTATTTFSNVSCHAGTNGIAMIIPSGGATPYTYSWSPSGGTNATASGLVAGNYTCDITDHNGCKTTGAVSITQPAPLTATVTQTNVSCSGGTDGTAGIVASGGTGVYTYTWLPTGGNAGGATNLPADNYTCTITDANNCTAATSISITQPAAIISSQSFTVCQGQSITVGSSIYTVNGTYTNTLTASGGCDSTVTTQLTVNSLPVVSAGVNTATVCIGVTDTLSANGANTYTWSANAGSVTTSTVSISPTANTTYSVTGTDANGCVNNDTVTVIVQNCSTGINKISNGNELGIYPNPASNMLQVVSNNEQVAQLQITDMLGHELIQINIQLGKASIDISGLANGVYFIRTAWGTQKFVKQQ